MRSKILQRAPSATIVNLTGDRKALDAAQGQLGSFCAQLFGQGSSSTEPDWSSLASLVSVKPNEAFSVPTQVNYVAKGGSLYKPGEVTSGRFGGPTLPVARLPLEPVPRPGRRLWELGVVES